MKPTHKKELHNLVSAFYQSGGESDLEDADLEEALLMIQEESDLEEAERIVKVHRDSRELSTTL